MTNQYSVKNLANRKPSKHKRTKTDHSTQAATNAIHVSGLVSHRFNSIQSYRSLLQNNRQELPQRLE